MNPLEEDCLAALRLALGMIEFGDSKTAFGVFDDVLRSAAKLTGPEVHEIELVAHHGKSRLYAALKQEDERDRSLARASALARKLNAPGDSLESVNMVADTLMSMGENQLAIPYCNQAVALTRQNAAAATARLWRAGRCYLRAGFPDDARVPLRDAMDRMRKGDGAGLLPFALLDLGNACLQSDPVQAESCYLEAAGLWAALNKRNQAATAWLNLGVLCSRADRLDDALAWYEKVREARGADPAATLAQRGNIHNNIASVWRKKGDFEHARAEVTRAIDILTPEGGGALAHAYGSFGEICRDEGSHEDAVTWFRRAREEFERQPSPKLDQLVTKLENEATALDRVGRDGEAATVREKMARLKGLSAPPVPTISLSIPAKDEDNIASVIVSLDGVGLPDEIYAKFDLATLERHLTKRLEETSCGEFDGNEFGAEATQLFFYGRDARKLFDAIEPVLREYPLCRGARIQLKQGAETSEFPLEQVLN